MRSFHINSFGAAIFLSALFMGILGAFVIVPIACIQCAWNLVATHFFSLPAINAWQAILLYVAFACIFYLLGLVQVEIKTETID